MRPTTFKSSLQKDTDGTWWYVHVPKEVRKLYKQLEKRGIIHITVTIGHSTWDGSVLPWADGSGQISINSKIRNKENLTLGDLITITIAPR